MASDRAPTGRRSWPHATTTVAGVIGDPVAHSLSPLLHNTAFAETGLDWVFVAFRVPLGRAGAALEGARSMGVAGLSVTMPHKSDVAAALGRLSPTAERLGAVNTVVAHGGDLRGDNTDGPGFVDSLRLDAGFDPAGRACGVVGAGGAGRAVALALVEAGASEVVVVNRTKERGRAAVGAAGGTTRLGRQEDLAGVELIVNATPVGMGGAGMEGLPLEPAVLRRGQLVADLVYHPAVTPLLRAAREAGSRTLPGIGMLVHQAARAFTLWTGVQAPVEAMRAAAHAALDAEPVSG